MTFNSPRLNWLLLIAVLTLAAFLRLYQLENVPPGFNRDEASIAYTAASLLKTGRDEYARAWPISFQSFGDWKLPLYIYLTVPFVGLLGVTELAVRLPSAIAGILTVLLTYFLIKELFGKSPLTSHLSLLTSFLLAISPWHIHLSRVESESNVAVLLTTAALLLFFKGLKKSLYLVPSLVFFALTYYTYHGNHIFTTILLVGLGLIYRQNLPPTKELKLGLVLFAILIAVILSQTFFEADKTKVTGISIFGDPTVVHQEIELPRNVHSSPQSIVARLFHNRVAFAIERILQNYLRAWSPEFLFIKGGGNRAHNIADFGNMYLVEAPFLLLGLVTLLLRWRRPEIRLIIWWIAISPLAASITKDAPHTNRMFAIFPALPLVVALGVNWLVTEVGRGKLIIASLLVLALAANMAIYLERYYVHFPQNEAQYWGLGYKKLVETLSLPSYQNARVIMSAPETSPYIYLLAYSGFDPAKYQKEVKRYPPTSDGFVHVQGFDRFEFRQIDWAADLKKPNSVIIDFLERVPPEYQNRIVPISQFALISTQ